MRDPETHRGGGGVIRSPRSAVALVALGLLSCGTRDTWEARSVEVPEEVAPSSKPALVDSIPRFEDYPVSRIFSGTPAPVNLLSHHSARRLRSRLVGRAKEGPNFAGHYTVVRWRSASGTEEMVLVEARTGLVFVPSLPVPQMSSEFRLDSRLFIVNPPKAAGDPVGDNRGARTVYALWEGNGLVPIRMGE